MAKQSRAVANTVSEHIKNLVAIHEQRKGSYGQDYLNVGPSLAALFPDGVELTTPEDYTRFALFLQAHGKLARYAARFKLGGHPDSLDDVSVYAQLLRFVDGRE
jgi:hypothetical protein